MKLSQHVKTQLSSSEGRSRVFTAVTMIYNFIWSACKIFIGIFTQAYFFCINGAGTLFTGIIKLVYIRSCRTESGAHPRDKAQIMNILLIITGACYIVYMAWYVAAGRDREDVYSLITAIAIAAAATLETVIAVRNLIVALRSRNPVFTALRKTNAASAAFAVVLTQVALLSANGVAAPVYNAAFGMAAGAFACILGAVGVANGMRRAGKRHENRDEKSREEKMAENDEIN